MATEAPWAHSHLWPDETNGPWLITIWWRPQHGAAVPVGFQMTSWTPGTPTASIGLPKQAFDGLPGPTDEVEFPQIDAKLLRSVPLGSILQANRESLLEAVDNRWGPETRASMSTIHGVPQEQLEKWMAGFADQQELWSPEAQDRPRGSRDLGDSHYRDVAATYREAVKAGAAPTAAVAERFTLSKSAAAKQVARARERGFLPKTSRGRVGKLREDL